MKTEYDNLFLGSVWKQMFSDQNIILSQVKAQLLNAAAKIFFKKCSLKLGFASWYHVTVS
jgi:hypothetical protein